MRVTNKMLSNNILQNLQRNLSSMQKTQHQLSSGRSVSKPSDDPLSTVRIMGLQTNLGTNEQYKKNIDRSLSWLGATEVALGGVNDVLQRTRELAVSGASGTLSDDARFAIKEEVEQLKGNLLQIANSDIEGRYIFSGFKTDQKPYEEIENGEDDISVEYMGDDKKMQWEVARGVAMEVNLSGEELFGEAVEGNENYIFNIFDSFMEKLQSGSEGAGEISEKTIKKLDDAITNVLNHRAVVGARMNRLEMAEGRNFDDKHNMTTQKSNLFDVDIAELVMDYSVQESVYHAALSTGSRAIQPSLVDFLR